MEFKDKLKELRTNANLKQEDVASRLFVSRTLVSKWESGDRYPSDENLDRIAELFQMSRDELTGTKGEENRPKPKKSAVTVAGFKAFLIRNSAAIFAWAKAILSVGLIPLWFVEFFIGHSGSGGLAAVFPFSMYDYMRRSDCLFLSYVSIGLLALSATLALYSLLRRDRRHIRKISHAVFGVAVGSFLVFLALASLASHGSALF